MTTKQIAEFLDEVICSLSEALPFVKFSMMSPNVLHITWDEGGDYFELIAEESTPIATLYQPNHEGITLDTTSPDVREVIICKIIRWKPIAQRISKALQIPIEFFPVVEN